MVCYRVARQFRHRWAAGFVATSKRVAIVLLTDTPFPKHLAFPPGGRQCLAVANGAKFRQKMPPSCVQIDSDLEAKLLNVSKTAQGLARSAKKWRIFCRTNAFRWRLIEQPAGRGLPSRVFHGYSPARVRGKLRGSGRNGLGLRFWKEGSRNNLFPGHEFQSPDEA